MTVSGLLEKKDNSNDNGNNGTGNGNNEMRGFFAPLRMTRSFGICEENRQYGFAVVVPRAE
jgi:hypothetical protein